MGGMYLLPARTSCEGTVAGGKLGVIEGGYKAGSATVCLLGPDGEVGDSEKLLLLLGCGLGVLGMGGLASLGVGIVRV
jgi:hypothetical protein